jgi:hypothetical protein
MSQRQGNCAAGRIMPIEKKKKKNPMARSGFETVTLQLEA